jgi:serine/threonine protein kinase
MDVKPQNILLDASLQLRLSDFGGSVLVPLISHNNHYDDDDEDDARYDLIINDGLGRGTQAYSPPEIFTTAEHQYSFSADIYSLGCTLFTLLTGREPFDTVQNPAYKLLYIKRGFWESGINQIGGLKRTAGSAAAVIPPNAIITPVAPPISPILTASASAGLRRSSSDEMAAIPLVQFLNGESLFAGRDRLAYDQLMHILKKTTALRPTERPKAKELLLLLDQLEVTLSIA